MTARGDHRWPILETDRDRQYFLHRYADIAERHAWVPLTYCLMSNHLHLVVETPRATLGDGNRDLLSGFAKAYNDRHDTNGHVFQGRFHSRLVLTEQYLAQLLRYVALNPVAARICATPESWPWSGHAALVNGRADLLASSARVEELLDPWGGRSGTRYRALFATGHPLAVKYGDADPFTWRPPLEFLLSGVPRDPGLAAAREYGYRLHEIADHLGVHESTVSRWVKRACKKGV